jgi:putative transposase
MDTGVCFASSSTFRRICKQKNLRPKQVISRKGGKRPYHLATAPNRVWCWDITWLETKVKGKYFYLYMIIDMYSRKVVGWDVFAKEVGALARDLFATTLEKEGIQEGQVIVHEGSHLAIYAQRNSLLEANRKAHPSRHGGKPKVYAMNPK